jgi:replicative DNA helicase
MSWAERPLVADFELEQAVVGSLMLRGNLYADVIDVGLTAADFYSPPLRRAFQAISLLFSKGEPIDTLTVANAVAADGHETPDAAELISAMAHVPAQSHLVGYARRVHELGRVRRLAGLAMELLEIGTTMTNEVEAELDKAEQLMTEWMTAGDRSGNPLAAAEIIGELLAELAAREDGMAPSPVTTGLCDLDRQLRGGLRPGQLVIVGARPAQGKTALALGAARAAATRGVPTLFFSLEMSGAEIAERLVAMAGVPTDRLVAELTEVEWERAKQARRDLDGTPLVVDDDAGASIATIRSRARRALARGGLGLVVVDYLQLVNHRETENRQTQVAEISRELKRLARQLAVPILATAQLSRALESRAEKRPVLGDLRESGQIENDADVVCLLHRPIAYDANADPGIAEVIVAKQRSGPTGTVPVVWLGQRMKFVDALTAGRF